jgi:hypothetical protein
VHARVLAHQCAFLHQVFANTKALAVTR